MSGKVLTPEFRISFPSVFEKAPQMDPKAKPEDAKYEITMLFPKNTDISKLRALAVEAAVKQWGADKTKHPANLRNPVRDGEEKSKNAGYAGHFFAKASTKRQPGIYNLQHEDIIDRELLYGGCYCRAQLTAYTYDFNGNRGVAFGMESLQKLRDGEHFGRVRDTAAVAYGDPVETGADDAVNYAPAPAPAPAAAAAPAPAPVAVAPADADIFA